MNIDRRHAIAPFAVLGTLCVIAGGLVAAATAPVASLHGSWAAAYLVLVAGVSQVGLGVGQGLLAPRAPSTSHVASVCALWNAGNAAVLAGVLTDLVPVVDIGGALLVIALALVVLGARGGATTGQRTRRWTLYGFRLLVLVLLVSIPVGLVLTRTLHA